jgi:hypothetical protein
MYESLMKLAVDATGPRTLFCWYPEVTEAYNEGDHTWPPIAILPLAIMNTGVFIVWLHAERIRRAVEDEQ